MPPTIGIYKICNKITGKYYVGSSLNTTRRWKYHVRDLNKNKHCNDYLQRAWNTEVSFVRSALVFQVETGGSSGSVSINANEIAKAVWQWPVTGSLPVDTFGDQVYRKLLTLAQYMATK